MNTENNPFSEQTAGDSPPPTGSAGGRNTLDDFFLQETVVREAQRCAPARVLYGKGVGAFGRFTVKADISKYSRADLFSQIGKQCRVFVRFSALKSERGTPDSQRDTRGFALKFYTKEGNWDLVGSNMPVFFLKDPAHFSAFLKSHKRSEVSNLHSPLRQWDFWSKHPETLHYLLMKFSARGLPRSYRHMHGYGAHTYSFLNKEGEKFWVKFHLKTQQGIQHISPETAADLQASYPDYYAEDIVDAIESGNFPKWKLYVQIMSAEAAKSFRWNPFDVTKVWPHAEFPLVEIGELELNELPTDHYSQVEQATFSPANTVPGIGYSPDPLLRSRIFTYSNAHRHRVGTTAQYLPVNSCLAGENFDFQNSVPPCCTTQPERIADTFGRTAVEELKQNFAVSDGEKALPFTPGENENDHYTQAGLFYSKALNADERKELVHNLVRSLQNLPAGDRAEIINRLLCSLFRANIELGLQTATGLGVNIDSGMVTHMATGHL